MIPTILGSIYVCLLSKRKDVVVTTATPPPLAGEITGSILIAPLVVGGSGNLVLGARRVVGNNFLGVCACNFLMRVVEAHIIRSP